MESTYYVHVDGSEPETGHPVASRQDAAVKQQALNRASQDSDDPATRDRKWIITFVASEHDRYAWHIREEERYRSGSYIDTPWTRRGSFTAAETDSYDYTSAENASALNAICFHFPHLSVKSPGMIAYTPSDEHGIADRQVMIKPGRYLEQFLSIFYSKAQRDRFVATIKGRSFDLKLARTAEEIETVYLNGPRSCMAHSLERCKCCSETHFNRKVNEHGMHPTAVYANSDLAIAYMGDLAEETISARCIVWPDRKLYGRIYGDSAIRVILESAGYEYRDDFDGATVNAIKVGENGKGYDLYLMPYVDCASSATLSRDRKTFELHDHEDGAYGTRYTDGLGYRQFMCDNCGDAPVDERGDYCDTCNEDRRICTQCERVGWTDNFESVGDHDYCSRCFSRLSVCDAPDCSERIAHDDESAFCSSHEGDYGYCDLCSDVTPNEDLDRESRCPDCTEDDDDEDETEDETETNSDRIMTMIATHDTIERDKYGATVRAHYRSPVPIVSPFVVVSTGDSSVRFHREVLFTRGSFAVHVAHDHVAMWTVTHIPTGRRAYSYDTYADAVILCRALSLTETVIDWSATDANRLSRIESSLLYHLSQLSERLMLLYSTGGFTLTGIADVIADHNATLAAHLHSLNAMRENREVCACR